MQWFRLISVAGVAAQLALSAAAPGTEKTNPEAGKSVPATNAPVLKRLEPADNVVITLPGTAQPPKMAVGPALVPDPPTPAPVSSAVVPQAPLTAPIMPPRMPVSAKPERSPAKVVETATAVP